MAADVALEDDVAAVGGPGRVVVGAGLVSDLEPAHRGDVHDVNILTARVAWPVFAIPAKGEQRAIRGPGWRNGIASVREPLHAGAVDVHGVDLRLAGAPSGPGNLRVGARVEGGRNVGAFERSQAVKIAAA